jgi:anti-sigma regulatory factor (Ser/Thr protein kinase)
MSRAGDRQHRTGRQPGYSTASDLAREMGFGAGMGLSNIERCADKMNIWSAIKVGTRVEMVFAVPPEETVSISS